MAEDTTKSEAPAERLSFSDMSATDFMRGVLAAIRPPNSYLICEQAQLHWAAYEAYKQLCDVLVVKGVELNFDIFPDRGHQSLALTKALRILEKQRLIELSPAGLELCIQERQAAEALRGLPALPPPLFWSTLAKTFLTTLEQPR